MAGFALALFVALFPVTSSRLSIVEGGIATRTVRAPRDISFFSESLTERRQQEAAVAVGDSLIVDSSIAGAQQAKLNDELAQVRAIIEREPTAAGRTAALQRLTPVSFSPGSLSLLGTINLADLSQVETESRRTLAAIFDQSLRSEDVSSMRERAPTFVAASFSRDLSTLIGELIRPLIVSNLVVDVAKTEEARAAARASVAPVQVSYADEQVIVEQGAPVTPEAREALRQTGVIESGFRLDEIGASALVALLTTAGISAGLYAFRPGVSLRELQVIGLAIAVPVFLMKVLLPFVLPDEERHFLSYLMPVAASSMVLAGFVGAEVALLSAASVALLSAFAALLLLDVTVVGIVGTLDLARIVLVCGAGGAAGVFAVRNADRLSQFTLGGFFVGASVLVMLLATWLIDPGRELRDFPWMLLVAVGNGALSGFLGAGIFVTLGSMFGVTTRLHLLEMSQLSQPLLARLQDEAPSTFQHSVIVASLAEKGAHVIGADVLLTRVGCYYHDIGKLARPGFFIENQLGGDNPHDALDPADSARIIADHVEDGLNLARQYRLPAKVAQFIPEHHGTRTVTYFYRRAVEEDSEVDAASFRYPGPKPQSRETAISMLADSCEAAVRASANHSSESIDAIVDEVFSERLSEGQLDQSNLTLNNVRALAQSFKSTLRAVYHPRVEYPAPTEAEMLLRRLPIRRLSEPASAGNTTLEEN
jgi:cyclic-di-AMP phosphodiesterase PgpH